MAFAADLLPGWRSTPGAVDWLKAQLGPTRRAAGKKVAKKVSPAKSPATKAPALPAKKAPMKAKTKR